jgi:cysteine-rich repeat protein
VEPSRDINTYVLFAYEKLTFKGADGGGSTGQIIGGNVGVNKVDPLTPPEPLLSMGGGGSPHPVFMGDGTQVVADTAQLDEDTSAFDLFVNRLVGSTPPVVRGSGPNAFTPPIIDPANLPVLPSFDCAPGSPVTVLEDGTLALAPGVYGDVKVMDRGTLDLGAGTYTFCSLRGGKGIRVNTVAGTVVQIASDLSTNNNSFVGLPCEARFLVRGDGVGNDPTVSFGRNSEFHGQVFSPNGHIALGHSTLLFGRFWGQTIGSDFDVNVTDCPETRCGDGHLDQGEQCDDGNTVDGDGCDSDCNFEEICDDLLDNDGDDLIDCFDPDCTVCPPIKRDPGYIRFLPGPDSLSIHGRIEPTTPIDPATEQVGILLTNENGAIYRGVLVPGDMVSGGGQIQNFKFVDRDAKLGLGIRQGLGKVMIYKRSNAYSVYITAYGDLSAATLPDMTIQLVVGNDVFQNTGTWKPKSYGWKLEFPRFSQR